MVPSPGGDMVTVPAIYINIREHIKLKFIARSECFISCGGEI